MLRAIHILQVPFHHWGKGCARQFQPQYCDCGFDNVALRSCDNTCGLHNAVVVCACVMFLVPVGSRLGFGTDPRSVRH